MAAGVTLGFLRYVLGFDTISFQKGMSEADRDLVKMQKRFDAVGSNMVGLGKSLSAAITLPLAGLAAAGIKEAQETAAAMAQVNSALASTGGTAGRTAEQLSAAANAFEGKSLFEADQILGQVSARLLAFGNISGQTFDKAQQAIIDYATRSGKDLGASTVFIGKALNDPAKAMGVLSKAGIQLTADQQKLVQQFVATGDVAGAQGAIIAALTKNYGGAAEAAQNADPWNKLQDAFKGVAEQIGTALIPIIPVLADAITTVANAFTSLSPEAQKFVLVGAAVAAATGPLLAGLGSVVKVVAGSANVVKALVTNWGAISAVFKASGPFIATAARAMLGLFTNPFFLGAALAIGGIYLAWKNWDKITAIVKNLYMGVKTWLQDKLSSVFDWVKSGLRAVGGAFKWLDDVVVRHSYVPDMVESIGQWFAKLDPLMVGTTEKVAAKTAATFQSLRDRVGGLLKELFPEVQQMADLAAKAATLRSGEAAGVLSPEMAQEARRRLYGIEAEKPVAVMSVEDTLKDLRGGIEDVLPAFDNLGKGAKGLSEKWEEAGYAVVSIVGQLFGNSKGGKIFGALLQGGLDIARALGAFKGARASGGPVLGRRSYLVGEKGPEIFTPASSGRVTANDKIGGMGGGRIQVVPSPYFDLVVDNRATAIVAPAAGRAALAGAAGGMAGVQRSARRRIP